jgi:hypothetical protein
MYVFANIGDSNAGGSRGALTDVPAGYYSTDNEIYIFDSFNTGNVIPLVPGPMEQQPGGATYVDPAYPNTVGLCGSFGKRWRIDNPGSKMCFYNFHRGGGRFTDANTTFGRAVNFDPAVANGAHDEFEANWAEFENKLAAMGYYPVVTHARISMGANPAQDATEAANFQTNCTAWFAALRTVLGAGVIFIWERLSAQQTIGNKATVINAQNAMALGNATIKLVNTDGWTVLPDNIHWTTGSLDQAGLVAYWEANDLWYPQKENMISGGNPVAHEWRLVDTRNVMAASIAAGVMSGTIQTVRDGVGTGKNPTQATAGKRPAIGTRTLPNGLKVYYADADGVDDILVHKGGTNMMFNDNSYGFFGAVMGAAQANGTLFAEGGEGLNPFGSIARNNAAGDAEILFRNDAGTVTGPLVMKAAVYNNQWNAIAVWDDGATVNCEVNGAAGTPAPYVGGARGATTLNRTSIFGINYSGASNTSSEPGGSEIHFGGQAAAILWRTRDIPDATYRAKARAFLQREYGTV